GLALNSPSGTTPWKGHSFSPQSSQYSHPSARQSMGRLTAHLFSHLLLANITGGRAGGQLLAQGNIEYRPGQMVGASHGLRVKVRTVEMLQPNDKVEELVRDDFVPTIVVSIEEAGTERDASAWLV